MSGLHEVHHLVNDDVFQEILRFFHQLGIEADVTRPVIAASPLSFHPLQEIACDLHSQPRFPLIDQLRYEIVEKGLVPVVDHLGAFVRTAAGAHAQGDAPVVERYTRFGFPMGKGQQIAPPPEIMALAFDELPGRFRGRIFLLPLDRNLRLRMLWFSQE